MHFSILYKVDTLIVVWANRNSEDEVHVQEAERVFEGHKRKARDVVEGDTILSLLST